ncbi:MAG: RluA family pseudouridine synthase [Gammaproteobacteria bacterium]|nr:RluA family pseudouridine synthase [Gammaproteobacteria bacterium]
MSQKVPNQVHFQTVTENEQGQRIDNFLKQYLYHVPKSHVYKIIRKGEVRVNKKRVKAEYKLKLDDQIRIPPVNVQQKLEIHPNDSLLEQLSKSIIFESNQLLVINKPSGLAVHGGSGISYGLIEAVRKMRPDERFLELVHRLDRDTSGCILIAKKRSVLTYLHQQLRDKSTQKYYQALVCGKIQGNSIKVDKPLRKNTLKSGERIVTIDPMGKQAISIFKPIQNYHDLTLVEIKILTGRTHQIRVHAQSIGHELVGDRKYGNFACNQRIKSLGLKRLFLHAKRIEVKMPDDPKSLVFEAPLSSDLTQLLSKLDNNYGQ